MDYTGRLFREGKAAISREVAEIFERLGSSAETWQMRLEKLRTGRLLGRFFAASLSDFERSPGASGCGACRIWGDARSTDRRAEPVHEPMCTPPGRFPSLIGGASGPATLVAG